jgi:predicted transcriptional regulator
MDRLGKLQRAVVETVWEMGEATVRQVWERLCPEKEVSYTTILAAMQRLEKSGWLRHRAQGKTNIYRPTRTREQAGLSSVRMFVQGMFGGSALLMFRHLVEEGELSDKELQELQRLIEEKRKGRQR